MKRTEKILSVLMSLVMILTVFPLASIEAFAADGQPTIDSVTIAPITCIPGKNGEFVRDSVGEGYTDWYYSYNLRPREVTLEFSDGTNKTYAYYELVNLGYGVSITSEQSFNNQYEENSTYTAYLNLDGKSYPYSVVIGENPIEKIEVEDVTLYENVSGDYVSDGSYDPDTGSVIYTPSYFYYNDTEAYNITVYMRDGRIVTGTPGDIDFYISGFSEPKIRCVDVQNYNNQWSVGNSYTARLYFGANITEFKLNLVENPVSRIEIEDFEIPELTNGFYNIDGAFTYSPRPSEVKLIYKDGTSENLTVSEIYEKFEDCDLGLRGLDASDTWTAGNTYPMSYYIGDVVGNFNVTITARSEESRKYTYNNYADGIEIIKYTGDEEDVVIPESIDGKKVVMIWEAFENNTTIKSVTLPNGLRTIGSYSFFGCKNLEFVSIPDTVTAINSRAFADCENLKSVYIPQSVETLGSMSFGYYDVSTSRRKIVPGFTIYGKTDSEAESYADRNSLYFVPTGEFNLPFSDVPKNEWYYKAVLFNYTQGYLQGYENGNFGPADIMQRQDFVVLLANIVRIDLDRYDFYPETFPDVTKGEYYFTAVTWAENNNIISGYADGRFGVGDALTREQMCLILYNYCDGTVSGDVSEILAAFPDGDNVSDWAREAVAWAAENDIVGGNGKLNPAGNANRAETAQIIMNMANKNIL